MHPAVIRSHASADDAGESEVDAVYDGKIACVEPAGEVTEGMDVNHVWKRHERRKIPTEEGNLIARFEVVSAKILPVAENANAKKYVLYRIEVRMEGTEETPDNVAIIERRYTELLNLYEALRKEYSTVLQEITFPKKRLMGNFSESLIAERAAAFETFLDFIIATPALRETPAFLEFIQDQCLQRACICIDERRHEQAIPILENCFRVLNKVYLDKSKPVLLLLCRLVAACTGSPIIHPNAEQWISLALRRFEHVSDIEILVLYVPLLQTCVKYYMQKNEDCQMLQDRLKEMGRKGIKVTGNLTLQQAVHAMEPRSETA